MQHNKSNKKLHTTSNGWLALLRQAENELVRAQERVVELKKAVAVFQHNVEAGIPFPEGDEVVTAQEREAATA
jgi:ribosomal protein L17